STTNPLTMPAGTHSAGVNYVFSGNPFLELSNVFADDFAIIGTAGHTFTLTVSNLGSVDAPAVKLVDDVPASLEVTDVDCDGGNDNSSASRVECTYSTLAANGGSVEVTVDYKVKDSADPHQTIVNEATVEDNADGQAAASDSVTTAATCGSAPLANEVVETVEIRAFCGAIEVGPAFEIRYPGELTLVAGDGILLGDGFVVSSGGKLVVAIDPALSEN
ncbi:MAG: hypothetical protein WBI27_16740, partial [Thermoanaerobaculia bacterium]